MKRCIRLTDGHAKSFSAFWVSKKAIFTKSIKWRLSSRMDLRNNLPPGRKKTTFWSRRSDVPRSQRAMRNNFVNLGHWKKRLRRSCLSHALTMRMAWRTHYLPPGCLKKRIWWRRWSDVSNCQKAMRKNFLHSVHRAILTKSLKWCFKLVNCPVSS
jgi:hypothetical protein